MSRKASSCKAEKTASSPSCKVLLAPLWAWRKGDAIKTVVYDVSFKKQTGAMSFEDGMAAAKFV